MLRTAARWWAPKLQVHQKAYELRAPMMGILFGAVTTTGASNTNQLLFGQTKLHSLLMSVVWVVHAVKKEPMQLVMDDGFFIGVSWADISNSINRK